MDRRNKIGGRIKTNLGGRSPLDFFDDDEHDESEEDVRSNGRDGYSGRSRKNRNFGDNSGGSGASGDVDEEEEDLRGRRPLGVGVGGGYAFGGSYLPTAYGNPSAHTVGMGPKAALGQPRRERSVDRIRARSRDSRLDISKERSSNRNRSRSASTSRRGDSSKRSNSKSGKANERAAERRRNRRASLEQSLGMMSMDDSVSSYGDQSDFGGSTTSLSLINGMDSSFSQMDHSSAASKQLASLLLGIEARDATSTDYTDRRSRRSPRVGKTWDGRLDAVLNRRRGQRAAAVNAGEGARTRSVSPGNKDKRRRRPMQRTKSHD